MEPLKKFILRIALLAAIIAFLSCMLNGISIVTSIFRSIVVYLLALLLEVIALNLMRWGIWATAPSAKAPEENKEVNQEKND
ncbi:hypothetical protein DRI50_01655 [candidate division KSB1 bacterium]|nr:MAG: hypothetical protein DRI50_01655 [candidate division KSB1 bacterium]